MTSKVGRLLNALDLEKYQALFDAQEIDDETLPELTAEDLDAIGLPLGPRKKLLKAIASLDSGGTDDSVGDLSAVLQDASNIETSDANWRQLTVMFCDLVGSTELSQRVDPEKLREINRAYQDVCTKIIEKYEGGPVGVGTIAVSLGESKETIEEAYEPFLIRKGLLKRTLRGRVATPHAYRHLGIQTSEGGLFDG